MNTTSLSTGLSQEIAEQIYQARHLEPNQLLPLLPVPSTVRGIVDDLTEILLQREGTKDPSDRNQLAFHIDAILHRVRAVFLDQAKRELKGRHADNLTDSFLGELPSLVRMVRGDIQAALLRDPAARGDAYVRLSYPGVWAVAVHRIAHEMQVRGMHIIARLMSEYAHERTGIDIHPGAQIGERFFIDHGTGVVIGETAVIGSDVAIYQGVTLGAQEFPRKADGSFDLTKKRHPTIGDHVTIYADAVIVGSAKIEDNSIVGSGARLVLKVNVPASTKVLPARQTLRFSGPHIHDDNSASS